MSWRDPSLLARTLVGLTRFELVTPRLSSVCSNQLSYRPEAPQKNRHLVRGPVPSKLDRTRFADNLERQIDLISATCGASRRSD